ncbi:MAG: NAD(+) synthase [Vicinamibacteria bacterium]|jgi:NAD+ synthase (glutamine-hydrolysing)|nr:NAD(+) synthase [Vicinamibacteria bacterium]
MLSAPFGFVRVAAASPRLQVANPDHNAAEIVALIHEAHSRSVQVLVFPELALTGYTCGDLFFNVATLVEGAERALGRLLRETRDCDALVMVGLPVVLDNRLFNAAAVIQGGRLLGVVPKTYIPAYKEFYEERWFTSARDALSDEIVLAAQRAPFGTDLLFELPGERGFVCAVEICEDLWVPIPPSSLHAVAGATIICNLSASNELTAKADYRRALVTQQSGRSIAAYIYAGSGVHESTTDVVFGGHLLVAENGVVLKEGQRFARDSQVVITEVDVERLLVERARLNSFADSAQMLDCKYRRVEIQPILAMQPLRLARYIDPHPFVPRDPATLDQRCDEIFSIQSAGLAKRVEHIGCKRVVLGLSGGLDSTLALLVALRAFDLLELPREGVLAVTMPGFGTSDQTLGNARRLAAACGVKLRTIDIRAACEQHIRDIGLDASDQSSITYQNLQARERMQVLMDLANKEGGLVLGTGDLSELALGWCTFAGDHMAMYNVNGGVPKTLVKELVRWVAAHRSSKEEGEVLLAILDTPVSPELTPPAADGSIAQRTEDLIGPYELHDFYLYCLMRLGAGPRKILFLAEHAFAKRYRGDALKRYLRVFIERFFAQQFKRSVLPDGPKVGSVSLSPRGDWRMPSDAAPAAWLQELE